MSIFLVLIFMIISYLAGSLCSAIIVSRLFSLPDPSSSGSKNPGATNILRLAGKKYAAIVLLGDMLKGLLPVLLAKWVGLSPTDCGFVAFAAVIGHIYPVFFNFKGGKGVATAIGALLGLYFILGVGVIVTWLIVANLTRYSSLASLVSFTLAPLYAVFIFRSISIIPPVFFISLFIFYQHRKNISRLIDRSEPKIRLKRNTLDGEIAATLEEAEIEKNLDDSDKS